MKTQATSPIQAALRTTPAEPSSPSDPNDESDESFDDWEDESDPVTNDCTYQCTEDGLFCDYDNCDECTGGTECCPCDGGELNSTCTNGDKTVLYCTDGCWEAENCGLGEVCFQILENIAACEPCTPCSEAGQVYCDVVGNRESMYVCTENFCLVEERCPPGDTCMYDRRPFMNDFSGVCRSTFFLDVKKSFAVGSPSATKATSAAADPVVAATLMTLITDGTCVRRGRMAPMFSRE